MDRRCEVWWGPAPHKSSAAYRPWVFVSSDAVPFAGEEAIALAITTQEHEAGISVPEDAWIRGGSRKQAYISPWYVTTIKHRDCDDLQGELAPGVVDRAVEALHEYTVAAPE